jgi:hypothetical protein
MTLSARAGEAEIHGRRGVRQRADADHIDARERVVAQCFQPHAAGNLDVAAPAMTATAVRI